MKDGELKRRIRFYNSFEEQAADEALRASQRTMEQRLRDTVALIMRVYKLPMDTPVKRVIKFY